MFLWRTIILLHIFTDPEVPDTPTVLCNPRQKSAIFCYTCYIMHQRWRSNCRLLCCIGYQTTRGNIRWRTKLVKLSGAEEWEQSAVHAKAAQAPLTLVNGGTGYIYRVRHPYLSLKRELQGLACSVALRSLRVLSLLLKPSPVMIGVQAERISAP